MPKKNLVHAWKKDPQVQECSVPELLRITLLLSRLLSAAPARMRRVGSGWRLSAAPSRLANVRFPFAIVLGVFVLCSIILDLMEKNPKRHIYFRTTALTAFLGFCDQTLLLICHILCERYLIDKMMSLVTILQQLEKMNISLKSGWYSIRYPKIKVTLLISFIAWTFISITIYVSWSLYVTWNDVEKTNAAFYTIIINAYLFMIVTLNQLRWSIIITEINSTTTEINSQITQLLQRNITDREYLLSTIRSLGQCYETICEIVRRIEKDSGMFLLFLFMSTFSKLILTPFNLISSLGSSVNNRFVTIMQLSWGLNRVISMLIIVEPCHWTRDQMERTHGLLIRLARRTAQRHACIFTELNHFILQVQMRGNSFTPMGVFTISRPLVATIFSGVTTYLAIVLQTQNDSSLK